MPDTNTPSVPPPTTEVSIRTLESDVAAVAASGGMLGAPASVTIAPHPVQAGHNSHLISSVLGWLAVFIAIMGLAAGAWLIYQRLDTGAASPTSTSTVRSAASSTGTLAGLAPTVASHKSLLAKPASASVSFPLIAPAGTLKTRYQLMSDGLAKIPASSRLTELVPTDASGAPLSFPGYLSAVGAQDLLDRATFDTYFQNDFTMLAARGQGGFSVAYLLALKPGQAWIYAEPGVRIMESSPSLANIFLQIPGKLTGPFSDATVQDQPVRTGTYAEPAGSITYGFFRDRLIIGTSRQALDEALLLLCFAPGSC